VVAVKPPSTVCAVIRRRRVGQQEDGRIGRRPARRAPQRMPEGDGGRASSKSSVDTRERVRATTPSSSCPSTPGAANDHAALRGAVAGVMRELVNSRSSRCNAPGHPDRRRQVVDERGWRRLTTRAGPRCHTVPAHARPSARTARSPARPRAPARRAPGRPSPAQGLDGFQRSARRSAATTDALSARQRSAIARPMPDDAGHDDPRPSSLSPTRPRRHVHPSR
jgi:hypothetical protein